jgi:hypothetical protein
MSSSEIRGPNLAWVMRRNRGTVPLSKGSGQRPPNHALQTVHNGMLFRTSLSKLFSIFLEHGLMSVLGVGLGISESGQGRVCYVTQLLISTFPRQLPVWALELDGYVSESKPTYSLTGIWQLSSFQKTRWNALLLPFSVAFGLLASVINPPRPSPWQV